MRNPVSARHKSTNKIHDSRGQKRGPFCYTRDITRRRGTEQRRSENDGVSILNPVRVSCYRKRESRRAIETKKEKAQSLSQRHPRQKVDGSALTLRKVLRASMSEGETCTYFGISTNSICLVNVAEEACIGPSKPPRDLPATLTILIASNARQQSPTHTTNTTWYEG